MPDLIDYAASVVDLEQDWFTDDLKMILDIMQYYCGYNKAQEQEMNICPIFAGIKNTNHMAGSSYVYSKKRSENKDEANEREQGK